MTILLSVDPSNIRNGGLEVVEGSHEMDVPINKATNCIESTWVDSQTWTPVELEAGQLSIFVYELYRKLTSAKASYSSSLLTWLTAVVPTRVALTARLSMRLTTVLARVIYARDTTSTGSRSGRLHICERLESLMRRER